MLELDCPCLLPKSVFDVRFEELKPSSFNLQAQQPDLWKEVDKNERNLQIIFMTQQILHVCVIFRAVKVHRLLPNLFWKLGNCRVLMRRGGD